MFLLLVFSEITEAVYVDEVYYDCLRVEIKIQLSIQNRCYIECLLILNYPKIFRMFH